jgi:DNA repair protein RecO (recombination protein O)
MFIRYRTQGFFLKEEDFREADQLFLVYTKEFGKVEILGKAIRKTPSKLRAGDEVFCVSEIEFIQGRGYKTLTDAIAVEKFKNLRKDLNKLKIVYQISQVVEETIKGQEKDEKIWRLLLEVFEAINNQNFSVEKLRLVYYYFLFNFLAELGYRLQTYNCVLCSRKITQEGIGFSAKAGGVLCKGCLRNAKYKKEISGETVKTMRIIARNNLQILSKIKINKETLKELDNIFKNYFSYVLGQIK